VFKRSTTHARSIGRFYRTDCSRPALRGAPVQARRYYSLNTASDELLQQIQDHQREGLPLVITGLNADPGWPHQFLSGDDFCGNKVQLEEGQGIIGVMIFVARSSHTTHSRPTGWPSRASYRGTISMAEDWVQDPKLCAPGWTPQPVSRVTPGDAAVVGIHQPR